MRIDLTEVVERASKNSSKRVRLKSKKKPKITISHIMTATGEWVPVGFQVFKEDRLVLIERDYFGKCSENPALIVHVGDETGESYLHRGTWHDE